MIPWEKIDSAKLPDGGVLDLFRRGEEYVIRVNGQELMGSRAHGSEDRLAELGCAPHRQVPRARVLIGGLGLGFTLRAALDVLGQDAQVDVAEISPAVVQWNRQHLGHFAGAPLDDPRTRVIPEDVRKPLFSSEGLYDAVLLDVDNGPGALALDSNATLYGRKALTGIARALKPGGTFALWSAADDGEFTARLGRCGFDVEKVRTPAHGKKGRTHVLWIGTKNPGGKLGYRSSAKAAT
ncbi:MAG: hypothetical protein KC416_16870 [Myxococcales bacterium]|nr:hypothetical protein [Myxococcales bacterium]